MENKKISHVEIYFEDSSMERISNEEKEDKKLTKKQIEWIIEGSLSDLNDFRNRYNIETVLFEKFRCIRGALPDEREITINNYNEFNEDIFLDLSHSEYQMLISLLDALK